MYANSTATTAGLLNSAKVLFLSKTYADVTMEDIAGAAGMIKGAAYHHFANKESLYVAIVEVLVAPYAERVFASREELPNSVLRMFLNGAGAT